MHGHRLGHLDSMTDGSTANLVAKFLRRKKEVDELERLTDKIKAYIKENKKKLISNNSEMERRIFEIHVMNNPKLKGKIEEKLEKGRLPEKSFSTSFLLSH